MPTFEDVQREELKELARLRERRGVAIPADQKRVGLALSGGGIRSATINLGILQALAHYGLLRRIDYLSTVSGGGFIGGWLERWIHEEGVGEVEKKLGKVREEPPPVNFLRDYSNYLTPRKGILGADTWAAIATYVRNVILNQAILAGFLGALLMAPWILGNFFEYGPDGVPSPLLIGIAGALLIIVAVTNGVVNTSTCATGEPREFTKQRDVLIMVALPLFAGAFLFTYAIWKQPGFWSWKFSVLAGTAVYGLGHLLGWLVSKLYFGKIRGAVPTFWNVVWALPSGAFAGLEVYGLGRLLNDWEAEAGKWHAAAWGTPLFVAAFLLAGALHVGLAKFSLTNEVQEWWGRLGGWLMLWAIFWSALFALAIYAPLGVTLFGKLLWTRRVVLWGWMLHSGLGARLGWGKSTAGKQRTGNWKEWVAKAAPFVFVTGLLVLLACAARAVAWHFGELRYEAGAASDVIQQYWVNADAVQALWLWEMLGILLGITAVLAWRVDINRFSMNLLYRNRLVRCYLGASNEGRRAQKFTGFDAKDDLLLAAFADPNIEKQATAADRRPYSGPYPILNATLDLTHGERLAWQERKAESFVFTPLFCGYEFPEMKPSLNLAQPAGKQVETYRATAKWAFPDGGPKLGLAMATSGAAVSPNMGYHTFPPLAFLMTVFNVRLGEWLANPRWPNEAFQLRARKPDSGPGFSLLYLLNELFANTTDRSKYVYLSDGAHFENLGLYELVRRGCDLVVVSDAGEDPGYSFGDLVNATRKCRTDLGAEIVVGLELFQPDAQSGFARTHAVRGEIRYRDGKVGQLLYFKSCLAGNEPNDVRDYKKQHPEFPQQSTVDQWFDETQFESYRMLGYRAAESMILRAKQPATLEEVTAAAPEN